MTQPDIRQPVALRTLHGIEMAAVGTWNASTGVVTFTAADFIDAVAALECPGVRNPVIKLGHMEPDSDSGIRWDGEPAMGWVAGMRFDGAKLIGDFTGMPGWLVDADENGLSVMAAAYPDRSIEIWRPFECQIGHIHPSVVTAISLLGIYPPAVGVLKSMQDVYAAFTTAPEAAQQSLARALLSTSVTLAAADSGRDPTAIEQRSGLDFEQEQGQWDSALSDLLDAWPDISDAQRDELAAQVADAVDKDPDKLGDIRADSAAAAAALLLAMRGLAGKAAAQQVAAAAKQGVTLPLPEITDEMVQPVAEAVASSMAASSSSMAARTAAQALGTGTGTDIADLVISTFSGLTDRFWRDQLGGALSAAQHRGRIAVLDGWEGDVDLYASEINDRNICDNCRSVDGTKFDSVSAADAAYGGGKYVSCQGGARCRGQLVAIFGSDRAKASAPLATTIRTNLGGDMAVVKASVSVEDISRKYYESAGYSMYITELQVDPLQLIAADDSNGKYYRIPVELSGDTFTFGDPQEVMLTYQDAKAAAKAPVKWGSRKVAMLAAGKNEDGTDRQVAPDVSPAGAAIRKAVQKTAAGVLDTEVVAPEPETAEEEPDTTQTPDAEPATGPTTTPKEASVDEVKMREALGLGPDATKDELAQAFTAQFSASAPATKPDVAATLLSALPKDGGAMLIDPENYKSLVQMAAQGQTAYEKMQRNERDQVLDQACHDGRFPVSRLSAYKAMWDENPEATKAYINLMPKNSVPVMAAGFLGAEVSQNETDMAYDAVYGGKAGA